MLIKQVLGTNLLSNFPKEINVYKDDVIGFSIHNFVNGTQNKNQVFPTPTIRKYPDEERVHTFAFENSQVTIESCHKTVSTYPLEYAHICVQKADSSQNIHEGATSIIL